VEKIRTQRPAAEPSLREKFTATAARVVGRGVIKAIAASPKKAREKFLYLTLSSVARSVAEVKIRPHSASFDSFGSGDVPRSAEALYYGRGLHVKRPLVGRSVGSGSFLVEDWEGTPLFSVPQSRFSSAARSDFVPVVEHEFRVWLESRVIPKLRLWAASPEFGAFGQTLKHEYCHHTITRTTSVATTIEGTTWRKRFKEMQLLEDIHYNTTVPRMLNERGVGMIRERFEDMVRQLQGFADREHEVVFRDIVTHHYFSSIFYPAAMGVLVEPVTWALVERKWVDNSVLLEGKLAEYFGGPESPSLELARRALTASDGFLGTERITRRDPQWAGDRVVALANAALDAPSQELLGQSRTPADLQLLQELLVSRFELGVEGEDLEVSDPSAKKFVTALSYGLQDTGATGYEVDRETVMFFSKILGREGQLMSVASLIVDMLTLWGLKGSDEWLTVLANANLEGQMVKLRLDPLTGLDRVPIQRTGGYLNRIDDLVGDLPPTISTCLSLLYYLDRWDTVRYQRRVLEFGKENLWADERAFESYRSAIRSLLKEKENHGLSYVRLLRGEPGGFADFARFWLTFIDVMGEHAKQLRFEHGMWE
jgi:hypothetical protein